MYNGGASSADVQQLIEDADAGERAEAMLEALKKALREQLGILVIDSTTDDDGGEMRIELMPVEEKPERCPRCDSPQPHLHPAVQHEGEVQTCPHPFHAGPRVS